MNLKKKPGQSHIDTAEEKKSSRIEYWQLFKHSLYFRNSKWLLQSTGV